MKSSILLLSLFLYAVLSISVASSETATVNITVADTQTGNRLNGVSLTVAPETGDAVTGVSAANGVLEITNLAAGVYTITASAPGYTDTVVPDFALAADETKSI
ncbi:carboxypeptidase regulatory-like domain-containing protein, partial [Candidatus Poribacteria bacterium]|nr:carboxypeptidase regulatory-like domain-containing protein [Candidatus Poribacteria bacterium]